MEYGNQQIRIIKRAQKYLKILKDRKIDTAKSALCYFSLWDETVGLCKIRIWNNEFAYITMIKLFLKEMWLISKQKDYIVSNICDPQKYSKLIVTWANKRNFLSNGSIFDDYFKINSRKISKTLWIVIYKDEILPKNIDKNIIIVSIKKNPLSIFPNFLFLLKTIFCVVIRNKGSLRKAAHYLSSHSTFGEIIIDKLKNYLNKKGLRSIIMPYEGQPFQQMIFNYAKKNNGKVKTIGYAHDAGSLQFHLFHRQGSPDKMLIQGHCRKKYFNKYLNWPLHKLKHIPSIRHRYDNYKYLVNGIIFFPNEIYDEKKIVEGFDNFLKSSQKKSLYPLKARKHPNSFRPKLQNKLKIKLEILMKKYKNRFSKKPSRKKMIIAVGASSLPIIALEKSMEVIHICMEPTYQVYSEEIWPDIKVDQLSSNVFRYNLRNFGKCLTFGKEKNMFNKYCDI